MSRMNPTVRGLLAIVLVAALITALQLQTTVISLLLIARVAFFLAIAFFLFLLWRDRRDEIATWSRASKAAFYGAVVLALADLGAFFATSYPSGGLEVLVFLAALAAAVYALVRVWRREHTYRY